MAELERFLLAFPEPSAWCILGSAFCFLLALHPPPVVLGCAVVMVWDILS